MASISSSSSSNPVVADDWTYDQYAVMDAQTKMIITCGLPFDISDREGWNKFAHSLQPEYERVSTYTVKLQALKYYRSAIKHLISYFQRFEGKVCLTIRIWNTSYEIAPYICVFCHWIDPETWKASCRIIGLKYFEFPFDAKEISDFVMSCVCKFKIKDKIMSISFVDDDDGVFSQVVETLKSDMNTTSSIGVLFHTKCAWNHLNSMVKSTLDYAATVVSKVQKMVDSVYYSEVRYDFNDFMQSKGEKVSEPCFALTKKWNTTYQMLDDIVKQRSLLAEFFAKSGKNYIEDDDWEKIESLVGILEVFRSSTVLLCNAYNATLPLVLGQSLLISSMFKQYKENPFWKPLISDLQSKFLKYHETMAPIFYCASVLNPMIGVGGIENILEDIEANLGLNGTVNIAKCGEILREVFDYYDSLYNKSKTRALVPLVASSTSTSIILQSVSRKTSKAVTISNDLELYTKTDFSNLMSVDEYENLNILEWWRTKGCNQYPILAMMVRDVLTIQASTVASEHAFSLKGRVLDQTRSELSTKTLELRIFLKEQFDTSESARNANLVEDSSGESEEEEEDDDDEDLLDTGYANTDDEDFYFTRVEPIMDSDSD